MSTFAIPSLTIAAIAAMFLLAGCNTTGSAQRASMGAVSGGGYVCPLTGETLPCPDCCPLNQEQVAQDDVKASAEGEGYECPLTGEILPCPKCCPLNKSE